MLDKAFEALKSLDWGKDLKDLKPIDDAIAAAHKDEAAHRDLEKRLIEVLKSDATVDAKGYACRKLLIVGTAESAEPLAKLLTDKDLSHMARFALEGIPAPKAGQVLRDALAKTSGPLKVGVISSLGGRGDTESVEALGKLLGDSDAMVAKAAAKALGAIRGADAAKALADAKSDNAEVSPYITDARLACAEALLADGKKAEAMTIYKSLGGEGQPKHVQLAAKRGLLAAVGAKN